MANVLNRITKQFLPSVNTPDFPVAQWVINPDISPVVSLPPKYWKINADDSLSPMSAAEQAAVDDSDIQTTILTVPDTAQFFGDGSDGVIDLAVNFTLTRDIYPSFLRVQAGATLKTASFRIIAQNGIIILGTISNDGADAVGSVAGAAATAGGTVGGGSAGVNGTTGVGVVGPSLILDAAPGLGGGGGNGGAGGAGAGGSGGAVKTNAALRTRPRRFDVVIELADTDMGAAGNRARFQGGAAGGSGAGDGVNPGGASGEGGGCLVLVAPYIFIGATGVLSSRGGAGGSPVTGNVGGGGGGGGGFISSVNHKTLNRGTVTVAGGAAGNGNGTGAVGQAGTAGKIENFVV